MICILKFAKGHNSVKSTGGVMVLGFCPYHLIMLYIGTGQPR